MAGTNEPDSRGPEETECSFQWDEQTQLYHHASSGFYHDPSAGWYYSSRDGLYYKFENGNYMLLETDQGDQSDVYQSGGMVADTSAQDESHKHSSCDEVMDYNQSHGGESVAYASETVPDEPRTECISSDILELPPPSEWLEDTLIDLYLSGYSNQGMTVSSDARTPVEADHGDSLNFSTNGVDNTCEREEGEWFPDDCRDASGSALDEVGSFQDEETWRAQYGQVIQSDEIPAFPVVELWDWAMVIDTKKNMKGPVIRLIGRLVRRSTKLHPSMPSNGRLLKTAPVCEVHLDLVRVRSGHVYKLRSPSVGYLASLSTYDSSNPTKDWGFPELSMDRQIQTLAKSGRNLESKGREEGPRLKDVSEKQIRVFEKNRSHAYRDRASERRALHGGFGVGPGQKKSMIGVDSAPSSPISAGPEEAAAESLNISFGVGSYARRILETMGWKEGEALGNSKKGLTEPLQAVGNKGSAGLGWDQKRHI